ncbi:MAG: hypothetical protein P4L98_03965 [Ancalomicrobiaceae bacterium]|nr:hypothetical protein [Ancalomicrobiaceae bacterium]
MAAHAVGDDEHEFLGATGTLALARWRIAGNQDQRAKGILLRGPLPLDLVGCEFKMQRKTPSPEIKSSRRERRRLPAGPACPQVLGLTGQGKKPMSDHAFSSPQRPPACYDTAFSAATKQPDESSNPAAERHPDRHWQGLSPEAGSDARPTSQCSHSSMLSPITELPSKGHVQPPLLRHQPVLPHTEVASNGSIPGRSAGHLLPKVSKDGENQPAACGFTAARDWKSC